MLGTGRLLEGPKWKAKELLLLTLFVQLLTATTFVLVAFLLWTLSQSDYYMQVLACLL